MAETTLAPTQASLLTPEQEERLARLLRNESDVAYRRRVRRMIEYLEIAPGKTFLDCGTGMGFYIKVIRELYPGTQMVGIDAEDKVLGYARDHLGPGPLLVEGDIHNLAFADASFDGVIMSEVLEHLKDDAAALKQVRRVMKPGAVLAVTVPYARYPYWYDPINRVAEGVFHRPIRTGPFAGIWANHERLYEAQALRDLLQGTGFELEVFERMTHYCFPGTQTIVYTFGKGLIDHNLLPGFISRSTHRFQGDDNPGSPLNPLNWALGLFHRIDRLNEEPTRLAGKQTFVNLAVKARRV